MAVASPGSRAVSRPGSGSRPHIGELDFVRAVACASVVGVHVLSMVLVTQVTFLPTNAIGGIFLATWHYTRETFMIVTGLVLVYAYGKDFNAKRFYGRRLLDRVLAYVIWSFALLLFASPTPFDLAWWARLGEDLLRGGASYQLYYVSVLLQFYLVFPLVLMVLRRFPRGHWWLVLGALALQIVWYARVVPLPLHLSPAPYVSRNLIFFLFTYPFYFTFGAVVGWHFDAARAFVDRHPRLVAWGAILTLAGLLGRYAFVVFIEHRYVLMGTYVFEPAMIFWSVGATALLYLLGRHLTAPVLTPAARRFSRVLGSVGKASYGIFLIHVAILNFVFAHLAAAIPGGPIVKFVVIWSLTFGASYVVTTTLLALPWVSVVMGRVSWWNRNGHAQPPSGAEAVTSGR